MAADEHHENRAGEDDFTRQAKTAQPGLLREIVGFLRHSKKVWLAPIIIGLLIIGFIVILGGTPLAPFIYTLF
jgi:hypothetical protein